MGDKRPGDNLYTSSTIAIDVATGAIKGYFQYAPNESWDWDEVSPPLLIDYQRNGRTVKGLIDVARDGYLWFLDRDKGGPIKFVEGKPFVYQNVFRSLDPVTGRPDVDPAHKPGTGKRADFCPGTAGGKNWPPIAYSPQTRMIYVPANATSAAQSSARKSSPMSRAGVMQAYRMGGPPVPPPATDHFGEVQAWNVDTGQKVWTHNFEKSPNWGGMLATAGGLVISGGTNDRMVRAFDAKDGKVLWEAPTSSGVEAPVTTYHGRWQAVHRRAVRLGRRRQRYERHHPADGERSSLRCPKAARCGCSRWSKRTRVRAYTHLKRGFRT